MNRLSPLYLALVASLLSSAHAGEPPRQPEVVVTASRVERAVDATLADISVIDRADIDASVARDIVDLLRMKAGIDVARTGGPGSQTTVFLRGTNNNHLLMLVDGVRVSSLNTGAFAFEQLPLDLVDRIEIVRGPRASYWGSDAIGGVVQVFTRKLDGPRIGAGFGSHGEASGALGFGHWSEAGGFSAQFGARHADGFKSQNQNGFSPSPTDDGYHNRHASLRGALTLGSQQLSGSGLRNQGRYDFSGGYSDVVEQSISASLDGALGERWRHRLDAGSSREDIETPAYFARYTSRRQSLGWQHQFALADDQQLVAGVDHVRDKGANIETWGGTAQYAERRRNSGLYAGWHGRFGALDGEVSIRHDDNNVFGTADTGSAAAGWHFTEQLRAYASYGKGFRAPTLNEQYSPGFGGLFAGNPDLDPETSRNAEVGLAFTPVAGQRLTASVYSNRVRNLISFSGPGFQAENVQRAKIRGSEIGWAGDAGDWHWDANATWQDPRNETSDTQLLRRAKRKANLLVERRLGEAFRLGGEVVHVGRRNDVGAFELPSYTLLNLRASYAFSPDWRIAGRVENLTGRDYEQIRGYNTPGRTGFVELVWQPQR